MVMRKLYKEFFVSIRKSFKRFLSITLIVLLGVGFFAGIRATSPDMEDTLSRYYKENNMYDIELMSNYGISQDDISKIRDKGYDIEKFAIIQQEIDTASNEGKINFISLPNLIIDILSLNIISQVMAPVVIGVMPGVGFDKNEFIENRKKEIIETITRRLTK